MSLYATAEVQECCWRILCSIFLCASRTKGVIHRSSSFLLVLYTNKNDAQRRNFASADVVTVCTPLFPYIETIVSVTLRFFLGIDCFLRARISASVTGAPNRRADGVVAAAEEEKLLEAGFIRSAVVVEFGVGRASPLVGIGRTSSLVGIERAGSFTVVVKEKADVSSGAGVTSFLLSSNLSNHGAKI